MVKLVEALRSPESEAFILERFRCSLVPLF